MRVLIINAILYTAETSAIPSVDSIKDTMIYDLCLGFVNEGHEVTLCAADEYRPRKNEEYPFEIVWRTCKFAKIFQPNRLPWMSGIKKLIKSRKYDLIISSEVFSINTLCAYLQSPKNTFAWHEIAKHQAYMHQIPSKIWYNIIVKLFMKNIRVIARSVEAQKFISQYCINVECEIIDHGVNLNKFVINREKKNCFVVCSQLIRRKRVDGIIDSFISYLNSSNQEYTLYIIGDGNENERLREQVAKRGMQDNIQFMGKMCHEEMIPLLSSAKALLVNTEKDNNMISIVESIAVGTPIITTEIPLNASYIREYGLGIVKNEWGPNELDSIVVNNDKYIENCVSYRDRLSTRFKVNQFIRCIIDNESV